MGVNVGTWSPFGSTQFSSNIVANPGFEPLIDRAIVVVRESTASGFADNSPNLARPDGFWNGATFEVRTGASAGLSGIISSSSAIGADGLPWFTVAGGPVPLAAGDAVAVTQVQTSGTPYNWFWPTASNADISLNMNDARPGSAGHAVVEMKLQSSQGTELDDFWDTDPNNIPGGKFLPVNGAWELSFWAHTTTSDTANIAVTFMRAGSATFISQSVSASGGWQKFVIDFNAVDGSGDGPLKLSFVATGAAGVTLHLDDVQLGRVSDLSSGWRAEVVQTLQDLHPGYLRDWQLQLGDTMPNRLASPFGRSPQRWQPDPNNILANFDYGLPEFLSLCHQVGAQPWIVLPSTMYDEEFTQFGSYLAAQQSTFGFKEIAVEFGNENWNPMFRGGSIPDPMVMPLAANRAFGLIRAAAGSSVPLHLVVNGLFANPQFARAVMPLVPQADAIDIAPYFLLSMNAIDSTATSLASMFNNSDENSLIPQIQGYTAGKQIDAYEVNLETTSGDAPASQRNPLDAGMVSGSALVKRLINGMRLGLQRQLAWDLSSYADEISPSVGSVYLWGMARDVTAADNFRPTGLALQMLNSAIGGDYYPIAISGPASNGLSAAAFLSTSGWTAVIASSNATDSTVAITFPASGKPPTRAYLLSAPSMTADNETTSNVQVVPTTISGGVVIVPAYSVVTIIQ